MREGQKEGRQGQERRRRLLDDESKTSTEEPAAPAQPVSAADPFPNPWIEAKRQAKRARDLEARARVEQLPGRRRAHEAVARALASGKLVRRACSWLEGGRKCGETPTEEQKERYAPVDELNDRWMSN